MIEKVKELRKLLPIPINEAIQLLKDTNGNIDESAKMFRANAIEQICEITGCDEDVAYEYYEAEKFDFNRTVSSIREAIYDANYKPIEGVTREGVSAAIQWLQIVDAEDFGTSLDYAAIHTALETMSLIPMVKENVGAVRKAKEAKDKIFAGYKSDDSIEEFVRRHRLLDDHIDFQTADKNISLKVTILKEELLRHARNIQ